MQDRFLKSLIYTILGTVAVIILLIQPINVYCRTTKSCHPVTLDSFTIKKKGIKEIDISFSGSVKKEHGQIVEFYPKKKSLTKFSNEFITNSYEVTNRSPNRLIIRAHYQLTPNEANQYLDRIECLCFQNQELAPFETVSMPIRFQIKGGIDEVDLKNLNINYELEIL